MTADATTRPPFDAVEDAIVEYVRQEFLGPDVPIALDTELLGEGMLDSLGVLRLATFVDTKFQLGMQPADFVIENFSSVAALAGYIRRTRKPPTTGAD